MASMATLGSLKLLTLNKVKLICLYIRLRAVLALNSAVNFLLPFIRQNQCKLSAIELAQIAETQLGLSNITILLFTTAVQISEAIIAW